MATAKTSAVTPKQLLERAVSNLPANASIDEAVDTLYVALKVGKGKAEIERGEGVSQEDVEESMARIIWSPQAREDLKQIVQFIRRDSRTIAAQVGQRIGRQRGGWRSFPVRVASYRSLSSRTSER